MQKSEKKTGSTSTPNVEINIPVGFEITEMGLDLWISSDKIDESLYFPINHIKFVHQVQNLFFALTNQELKLN